MVIEFGFVLVHFLIRSLEDIHVAVVRAGHIACHAGCEDDLARELTVRFGVVSHSLPESADHFAAEIGKLVFHDDDKFIAADTVDFRAGEFLRQELVTVPNEVVACCMALRVIDMLQVIDVEDHDREDSGAFVDLVPDFRDAFDIGRTVAGACQRIGMGHLENAAEDTRHREDQDGGNGCRQQEYRVRHDILLVVQFRFRDEDGQTDAILDLAAFHEDAVLVIRVARGEAVTGGVHDLVDCFLRDMDRTVAIKEEISSRAEENGKA